MIDHDVIAEELLGPRNAQFLLKNNSALRTQRATTVGDVVYNIF
jgi:hypothetical protein